ncbi:MAG: putative porin [Salibacteraceae bacterium]|jgi:hypothetical protein|nr:putative porin [Salibacteraceae bacterium]
MRGLKILFVFLIYTQQGISQLGISQNNNYWNLTGLGTTLLLEQTGLNRFNITNQLIKSTEFGFLNAIDSNVYTLVDFQLATLANQTFNLELDRPLRKGMFKFDLSRVSNPGFSNNSFIRNNRIGLEFVYPILPRLELNLGGEYSNRYLELNGGLVDSSYTFPSQRENGVSLFQVNSANANSEIQRIRLDAAIKWKVIEKEKLLLSASIFSSYSRKRFDYSDTYSDLDFYYKYSDIQNSSELVDSLIRNTISNTGLLSFNVFKSDTTSLDSISKLLDLIAGFGTEQSYIVNNGDQWQYANAALIGNSKLYLSSLTASLRGDYSFFGFKEGAMSIESEGKYTIDLDSLEKRKLSIGALVSYNRGLMPIQFFRYSSSLGEIRRTAQLVSDASQLINIGIESPKFSVSVNAGLRQLGDYSIMDKHGVIDQVNVKAQTLSLDVEYKIKWFCISNELTYQTMADDYRFSLPKVVNTGRIYFNTPLFNKALYIQPGIDLLYYSDYYVTGYHPSFDVYYVQNDKKYGSYLRSDVFLKAHIQTVEIELRLANWNYDLYGQETIVAPNYPGIERYFQGRVIWKFKN